jgi:hypothetical protein
MKNLLYLFLVLPLVFSSCKKEEGCTDPQATNYNADAEDDDGSCLYNVVATWNITGYTLDNMSIMSSVFNPYLMSGTWTVNTNNTFTANMVWSDATVDLLNGTWELIGLSTFALTLDGELTNWTITELDGNSMEITATIDGENYWVSLHK